MHRYYPRCRKHLFPPPGEDENPDSENPDPKEDDGIDFDGMKKADLQNMAKDMALPADEWSDLKVDLLRGYVKEKYEAIMDSDE